MPDLTGMFDVRRMLEDFQNVGVDPTAKARIQSLGPSFSESLDVKPKSQGNILEQLQGLGPATSLMKDLPGARSAGPQEPMSTFSHHMETGAPMAPQESDQPSGASSGDILGILGMGITDIGNAIGNPRAQVGHGGFYDLTKQRLAESQIQQLKSRQDLWDRTHTQAQAIPPEILSMPEMSGLAQAKAALDRDLLDGKIDNEKNVSLFLTELERAKPQIEQFQLQHEAQNQATQAQLQATAAQKLQFQQRQQLEAAAAQGDPEATRQLAILKAQEPVMRDFGGTQVPLTGSQWAQAYDQEQDRTARTAEHQASLANAEKIARIHEAGMASRNGPGGYDRDAARRGGFINKSYESNVARLLPPRDQLEMMDGAEQQKAVATAQAEALKQLSPRLIQAAKVAGIHFQEPNSVNMGRFVVEDQYFTDPNEAMQYLFALLQ
jgi:hypothetical protein